MLHTNIFYVDYKYVLYIQLILVNYVVYDYKLNLITTDFG
jgi:hypothetical protein